MSAEQFTAYKLTIKGLELQAKVQAGETSLKITRAVIGDGYLQEGQDPINLSELINEIPSHQNGTDDTTPQVDIIYNQAQDTVALIKIRVQSGGEEFYLREIGLMAMGTDGKEILYTYTNSGEGAGYFPPLSQTRVVRNFTMTTIIADMDNLSVNITLPEEVTREEFETALDTKADKTQYASITQAGLIMLHSESNTNRSGIIVDPKTGTAYIATNTVKGTVRDGLGQICISAATEEEILAKEQGYKPITPKTLDHAVGAVTNIKKNPDDETGDIVDSSLTVGTRLEGNIGEASFTSGHKNKATELYSAVIGGTDNVSSGPYSAVIGGEDNTASGSNAAVLGGCYSIAIGSNSVALGGNTNTTSGSNAAVLGGYSNAAIGSHSVALGGNSNTALDNQLKSGHYSKNGIAGTFSGLTGDAFIIGNGIGMNSRSNAFRVAYNGNVYGAAAYNSTGADYAEMFEWEDGNPNNEDRRGLFAYVVGDKMRIATSEDTDRRRLGVISARPAIVGDNFDDDWRGKYVTDIYGAVCTQIVHCEAEYMDMEVINPETGEKEIVTVCIHEECDAVQPILNPNYDPDKEYIPRAERPEFDYWSFIGKLVVTDDGTCEVGGYCYPSIDGIATACENMDKGFYVMERLDETHVKILIK